MEVFRAERPADWIAQARWDLETARHNREGGFFEWACFVAQQGAEKAVNAFFQSFGADAWGHSVRGLLQGLSGHEDASHHFLGAAAELARFYTPARYPNEWSEGALFSSEPLWGEKPQ